MWAEARTSFRDHCSLRRQQDNYNTLIRHRMERARRSAEELGMKIYVFLRWEALTEIPMIYANYQYQIEHLQKKINCMLSVVECRAHRCAWRVEQARPPLGPWS